MKALVLNAEPSLESRGWVWNGRCYIKRENGIRVASRPFRGAPRFTDAELAAEYWRAATIDTTYWGADDEGSPDGARAIEQTIALKRFATLPHYDEATS